MTLTKARRAMLVMRIRENPDLAADDLARIVDAAFADPFWTDAPDVGVVFSPEQFERWRDHVADPYAGPAASREHPLDAYLRRCAREDAEKAGEPYVDPIPTNHEHAALLR